MKYCIDCKHFADAHYSKTCISPRCKQRGDDDCAYMRQVVCGIEGELYEPKEHATGSIRLERTESP